VLSQLFNDDPMINRVERLSYVHVNYVRSTPFVKYFRYLIQRAQKITETRSSLYKTMLGIRYAAGDVKMRNYTGPDNCLHNLTEDAC